MALRTPPSWLQNGSHPAENDRLTTQAVWTTTGIVGSTSLEVTQNSPAGMNVRVASGWAAIVGTTQPNMGTYIAYNDATQVLTVTAADPTNPRIDRVVVTVQDSYYSGSADDVIFQVVAGTPAASPSAPATPANSISLATIAVAAGASTILTANITDTRVVATSNIFDAAVVTLTGTQTLTNKTFTSPEETVTVSATAATGTINFNTITQGILYYTTNATGNFTLNFRGNSTTTLSSLLPVGASITLSFLNTNGSTPYYANVIQIDGVTVTPKWQGGTAPSAGNASSIDTYVFNIIKTAATPTYTVLASVTKFA